MAGDRLEVIPNGHYAEAIGLSSGAQRSFGG